MITILGISAFYHDSAAALVVDGDIIAAAQEERFTRKKHDPSYPANAINYCLSEANISLDQVDYIAFYDKPFLKFERLLETYVALAPKGLQSFRMSIPIWLREKLFLKDMLIKEIKKIDKSFDSNKLMFGEHHFSHAASAFYASPFEEAIVLTLDGVGEWATTTVAIGKGNELDIVKEIHFPHSLGLLYSAFTYYTGFRVNSGEYKVMGLAPYGKPKYKDLILDKLIDLKEDGSFRLDQSYFNYSTGLTMVNQKFADLFGEPVRKPDTDELTQFHMDIAASVQAVTEEVVLTMTRSLVKEYDIPNLCMAGGVALNCVANGKILRDRAFKDIWIQPASGDAGGALGAALHTYVSKEKQKPAVMTSASLGIGYKKNEIDSAVSKIDSNHKISKFNKIKDLDIQVAGLLCEGKVIGYFQGRFEWGPRALGNRSIIVDPRIKDMKKLLNEKIKKRESFRPFAPSVMEEHVSDWFEKDDKTDKAQQRQPHLTENGHTQSHS